MSDPTPTPTPTAVVEPPTLDPNPPLMVPLESDDAPEPTPAPVATPEPTPTPPAPTPPAPEPPKMVPIAAVHEERTRRQNVEKQLRDAGPLLAALSQRPDIVAMLHAHASGQPAPTPSADQAELEDLAKMMVLYKADGSGQPDLDAAKRVREYTRATAKAEVTAALKGEVEPLRQMVVHQNAQTMRERVEHAAKQHGVLEHVGPLLDEALAADPNALADPRTGAALVITAMGLKAMQGGQTPAPPAAPTPPVTPAAPIITEPLGRRQAPQPELDAHMLRLAKRRGWDPNKMAKSLERVATRTGHLPVEKED